MLVPAMNIEEIRKDLNKDYAILFRKAGYVAQKLLKVIKPAKDKVITRVFDYYSGSKNKWLYKLSISQTKQQAFLLAYYTGPKGLSAFSKLGTTDYLLQYTAHFFERYNERTALGLSDKTEIMRAYINDAETFSFHKRAQLKKGIFKIYGITQKGLILGTLDENLKVYHLNTFIPFALLNHRQSDLIFKGIKEVIAKIENIQPKITAVGAKPN
jgi:hypothetical protein